VRRALIAAAATTAGLVLLLGYKAGAPAKPQKVTLGSGSPSTTVPAGSTTTTAGPGTTTTAGPGTTAPAAGAGPGTYTGQLVDYLYGDIEVAVTIDASHIANVSVVQNDAVGPRSQMIDAEAVPILEQEAVSAQGTNFDVVSGATYTSDAFAQSLQTALQKAGK